MSDRPSDETPQVLSLAERRESQRPLSSKETAIQVFQRAIEKIQEAEDDVDVIPLAVLTINSSFHLLNNGRHNPLVLGGLLNAANAALTARFNGVQDGYEYV